MLPTHVWETLTVSHQLSHRLMEGEGVQAEVCLAAPGNVHFGM